MLAVAKMFCEGCHSRFYLVMATYKATSEQSSLGITARLDRNCRRTGLTVIAWSL
jgi:hypothetical protein